MLSLIHGAHDEAPTSTTVSDPGLLVINRGNYGRLESLLSSANKHFSRKLYVRVEGISAEQLADEWLPAIYLTASQVCPNIDVRVLLGKKIPRFGRLLESEPTAEGTINITPRYKKVVLGGTFDRMHNGHKVLLSKAIMLASESITCGVTDRAMILRKTLYEMIEPVAVRMEAVREFVADVSDGVVCHTEPIDDAFGPSTRIADLEAIVVSEETVKGGQAVNDRREKQGMSTLDVEVVALVSGKDVLLNESKLSSSTRRREALGALLRHPNSHPERAAKPYIIGLTGGVASGKSSVAAFLQQHPNVEVIDADQLLRAIYKMDEKLTRLVGKTFPGTVSCGEIDREALARIVFSNKEKVAQLYLLVQPVVMNVLQSKIHESKADIVVIKCGSTIEANCADFMDELWTVFVRDDEAAARLEQRDHLTKEEAADRIAHQACSNEERVAASHVVFCSQWDVDYTHSQVARALRDVRGRLRQPISRF